MHGGRAGIRPLQLGILEQKDHGRPPSEASLKSCLRVQVARGWSFLTFRARRDIIAARGTPHRASRAWTCPSDALVTLLALRLLQKPIVGLRKVSVPRVQFVGCAVFLQRSLAVVLPFEC